VKDEVVDYSGHFNCFYDIFVGFVLDSKNFDLNYTIRDSRNIYANFVNLLGNSSLLIRQVKHNFSAAPTEIGYKDYGFSLPNHFNLVGKNLNELELEMKNRDTELMMQA